MVSYHTVDISNCDAVFAIVNEAAAKLGGLDAVVNCCAIELPSPLEDVSEDNLTMTMDVNVKGAFYVAQAAFPHLKDRGGSIVNFGSDGGLTGAPGMSTYAVSKGAAIHSLNRMLALEWGKYGIRANALLSLVMTPMLESHINSLGTNGRQAWEEDMRQRIPLVVRKGDVLGDCEEDLNPVIQFLVSDASKFVFGQLILVNGALGSVR